MTQKGTEQAKKHTLCQTARQRLKITGVCDVQSFDEQCVVLMTDCGEMTVVGEGLHVDVLDMESGNVELEGKINGLDYNDAAAQKRGWRARLFG